MRKGIIVEFLVKEYVLVDLETQKKIYVKAKGKIKKYNSKNSLNSLLNYSLIKIGDIVFYEKKNNQFLIDSICPRQNALKRPNIANVNQVFLVFSLIKPLFRFKLLDKFLLVLQQFQFQIVLIFTKIDLLESEKLSFLKEQISFYEKIYSVYYLNCKKTEGLEILYPLFKQKVTIFAGQTGVGKSTLINALTSLCLKTQEISVSLNRGKHTTKNSKLYFFYGGYIADTPGFSKLNLVDIKSFEIKNFYQDFLAYSKKCFFGNRCLHIHENKCRVKEAVREGFISSVRYKNYLSLYLETKRKEKKNFF